MKFKFNLARVLEQRKAVEDAAKRDWVEAKAIADAALREIDEMYGQIDESRTKAGALTREGGRKGSSLSMIAGFIEGQKIRIERARAQLRELMAEVERRHLILVEAAKERKTLEKLRERREVEYKLVKKRQELKQVDDIVVTRFARGENREKR